MLGLPLSTYGKRALEGDLVLLDVLDGSIGNGGLSILQNRRHIDGFPADGSLVTHVSGHTRP